MLSTHGSFKTLPFKSPYLKMICQSHTLTNYTITVLLFNSEGRFYFFILSYTLHLHLLQRLIETSPWGDEPVIIDQQIMNHNKFHNSIQRSVEVERAQEELVSLLHTRMLTCTKTFVVILAAFFFFLALGCLDHSELLNSILGFTGYTNDSYLQNLYKTTHLYSC